MTASRVRRSAETTEPGERASTGCPAAAGSSFAQSWRRDGFELEERECGGDGRCRGRDWRDCQCVYVGKRSALFEHAGGELVRHAARKQFRGSKERVLTKPHLPAGRLDVGSSADRSLGRLVDIVDADVSLAGAGNRRSEHDASTILLSALCRARIHQ